jgi:predicted nucleic acid-binding protein
MLTIDANVFVSSSSLTDKLNAESEEFLRRAGRQELQIYCPTLLLPEVASAIIRPTSDINAARITLASVETFPGIRFVPLTVQGAQAAVQIALRCRLRGADAVYTAVAQEFGTTLITWDQELLARAGTAVPTMTPGDWLAAQPI